MTDSKSTLRYWFVNCLGCKNPVPLFAEPIDPANPSSASSEAVSGRQFFRAWCVACGREYPYLSEAMKSSHEPPHDKQHRQIEFSRFRHRLLAKGAHA
jgi:hypothetical protein